MASSKAKTWALIALVVILALIVGGIIGFRIAAGILKDKVAQALGPGVLQEPLLYLTGQYHVLEAVVHPASTMAGQRSKSRCSRMNFRSWWCSGAATRKASRLTRSA